jgi:hypothetical protein
MHGPFTYIEIPDGTEISIYFKDYMCDKDGNRLEERREDAYECGDLIIKTDHIQYTFLEVMDCYSECMSLIEYISEQREALKKYIVIDVEEVIPRAAYAELVVEKW